MKEYILANAENVLFAFLVLAVVVIVAVLIWQLCKRGYKARVFKVLYELVCKAEDEIRGTKRGQERKAQVLAAIHEMLPAWARLFVTETDIDYLLEKAVTVMKQKLAEGAEGKADGTV